MVFFFVSSHVYGERKHFVKVSENSITKPSTLYGKTKLEAEKKLLNIIKILIFVLVEYLVSLIKNKKNHLLFPL